MNLHDIHHEDLLHGGLGEEDAYALVELEVFSLGDRYGALSEVPLQTDVNEEVTEI
jgi:hypothetical protein